MYKTFSSIFITIILFTYNQSKGQESRIIDKVVAVVGNQVILKSEVEEQFLQYQARGLSSSENQKCEIFEQLLFQKLLVVQAKIDSIEVSEKQVSAEIDGRLNTFIEQIGSKEKLEEYFGKSLLEIKEDFKPIVEEQIISQKMQAEITKDVKITPSDVKKFFQEIPIDSLPLIDAQFEIAQIVKKPKISEEEQKSTKDRLNALRDRIVNGESFKTLAVLYSDDKSSAKNGGELGYVNKSDFVTEFSNAAFDLEENELSEIVETEFGFHIIQLIGRKGDKINVRHILLVPNMSSVDKYKAKTELDSITRLIRLDSLKFEEAAIKFSDDEDTRNNGGLLINPYTRTSKFKIKEIEPSTNYALRDLKVGQISPPFESSTRSASSEFKIIYLKSKSESHTVNMKDDYQLIQDMAEADKKEKKIAEWVKETQKETYIKLEDDYKNCEFNFPGWIK
ncbi:MAG: peptidylprolyl isomerase [Bacteroidales bacterium]|nr:peptidylprolyl isomerase [Bacteroidales bacterium]